jgi:hypothetical protein
VSRPAPDPDDAHSLLTGALLAATTTDDVIYLIAAGAAPANTNKLPYVPTIIHARPGRQPDLDQAVAHWHGPDATERCAAYAASATTDPVTLAHIAATDRRHYVVGGLCRNPHLDAATTRQLAARLFARNLTHVGDFSSLLDNNQHLTIVADAYLAAHRRMDEEGHARAAFLIRALLVRNHHTHAHAVLDAHLAHATEDDRAHVIRSLVNRVLHVPKHQDPVSVDTLLDICIGTADEHDIVRNILNTGGERLDSSFIDRCGAHYPDQLHDFLTSDHATGGYQPVTIRAFVRFAADINLTVNETDTPALLRVITADGKLLEGTYNNHTLLDDILTITAGIAPHSTLISRILRRCALTDNDIVTLITTYNHSNITDIALRIRREQRHNPTADNPTAVYLAALDATVQQLHNDITFAANIIACEGLRRHINWDDASSHDLTRRQELSRQVADCATGTAQFSDATFGSYINICRDGDPEHFDNHHWQHLLRPSCTRALITMFRHRNCTPAVAATAVNLMMDNRNTGLTLATILDVAASLTPPTAT